MVRTHNLTKYFEDPKRGTIKAVDGVSFTAQPGQVLGLLGANGAGKTTTLRMLSTVIQPTGGTADINGHDILTDSDKVRASIGFLSTSTALYGRLTGNEVLRYFGGLYGMEPDAVNARIQEIVAALNLQGFIDGPCDKYSTGQKQRLSIARTILHNPPVLFFDEPTSGLDVVSSQQVMEFIERSKNEGKTVIFSTHIMSEVERLCDNIVVIHNGKVCGEGSVESLKNQTNEQTLEKAFLSIVGFKQGQWESN